MKKIVVLRHQQRITQTELARRLGVDQSTVSRLERRPMTPESIPEVMRERLENIFGRPVATLMEPLIV